MNEALYPFLNSSLSRSTANSGPGLCASASGRSIPRTLGSSGSPGGSRRPSPVRRCHQGEDQWLSRCGNREHDRGFGSGRILGWCFKGDTPSAYSSDPLPFKLSSDDAKLFDEGIPSVGAIVAGRRTSEVSKAWGRSFSSQSEGARSKHTA